MLKEIWAKINPRRVLLYALYMFLALVFQTMVLTYIRPLGVCPFVLPAAAVAVGMFEGGTWGAVFGLVLGIFTDMVYVESTVTYTLLFPALAFATGFVSQFFINRRFFGFMLAAAVGLLLTALVQMIKIWAADSGSLSMVGTAILQTLWSLPPAALAYFPPARWIE